MKLSAAFAKQVSRTSWPVFITKVLAFIGLWQVLSNSITLLTGWLS